jgi:hypothetical protein
MAEAGAGTQMMDARLVSCYRAIFGLTEMGLERVKHLTKLAAFMAAHVFTEEISIRTMQDFHERYAYIARHFEANDFIKEFNELYPEQKIKTDSYQASRRLKSLKNAIDQQERDDRVLSALTVQVRIHSIILTNPDNSSQDAAILEWLKEYQDRGPGDDLASYGNAGGGFAATSQRRRGKENVHPIGEEACLPALLRKLQALG